MKAKQLYLSLAGIALLLCGCYAYFFSGPYRFVDRALQGQSLQHLRSSAAPRSTSPADAADEYLHWWCHPSDRPNRSKLDITTAYRSPDEAIVTVIDWCCEDDSLS